MEVRWSEEPCRCPRPASWRNGYCESGFASKRIHTDAIDFWRVTISDDDLPDGLLANAGTADKEKHGSLIHRAMPHRVSRGSNFGQLASGFNSGKSAGRSG